MSSLKDKRVVITRAPHQAAEFELLLRERGAIPLLYPVIDIVPAANPALLDDVLVHLQEYDWLVLTSTNTVQVIADRLAILGIRLSGIKIAAVGASTAQMTFDLFGVRADLVPEIFTAEHLASTMHVATDARILLPQSAIAEATLAQALTDAGAKLTVIPAYQTTIGSGGVDLPALIATNQVDVITFTSPSTVRNLLCRLNDESISFDGICIACIGTKTAAAAQQSGLTVSVIPAEHTLSGLVAALEHYFETDQETG